jgi:hypothetical protein
MTERTPGPWKTMPVERIGELERISIVTDAKMVVADVLLYDPADREEDTANAAYIVRACNAHDDLLAACEAAEPALWILAAGGSQDAARRHTQLKAAIRKAKGE